MKPLQLFILSVCMTVFSACRSSDPFENIVSTDVPRGFNCVSVAGARSLISIFDDVTYAIVFDDTKRVANLTISNLRVDDDQPPMTLTFTDVPMSYTSDRHEKERIIKADVLVSDFPATQGIAITDVEIVYTRSNDLDPNNTSGIYARYVVDGRYQVTAYPYNMLADGMTRIDENVDGQEYIDYNTVYYIDLYPSTMTADLAVVGLSVGGTKKALKISGLKLSLTEDGYVLESGSRTLCTGDGVVVLKSLTSEAQLRDELRLEIFLSIDGIPYRISGFLTPNLSKTL